MAFTHRLPAARIHRSAALRAAAVLIAALAFGAALPGQARAAGNIVVNSTADPGNHGDGQCSLYEAVTNANTDSDTSSGDCAAGSGADTITFASNITISTSFFSLPDITSPVTITGNGPANTIIEASACDPIALPGGCTPAAHRIFTVASGGDLTLNNMTLRYGHCVFTCNNNDAGSAVSSAGALTLNNVVATTNQGRFGTVYSSGALTIANSTITANTTSAPGGGLTLTGGTATVSGTAISNNLTDNLGGGIYMTTGTALTLHAGSQVTGNTSRDGGGIFSDSTTTLTIDGATISGNHSTADAGGIDARGTLAITNTRLTDNTADGQGGALLSFPFNGGTTSLTGSCITGNSPPAISNLTLTTLAVPGNWWGSVLGPVPGHGDTVGARVDGSGFLTTPILGCGTNTLHPVGLSANAIKFASQVVNATLTSTITLTNNGDTVLNVGTPSIDGEFSVSNGCDGKALAVGAACTFVVTFAPVTPGDKTATLTVPSDSPTSPDTRRVTGTALPLQPGVSLQGPTLDLGTQLVGHASPPVTYTIQNVGTVDLHISAITGTAEYAIATNTCPAALARFSFCSFSVVFTPSAAGSRPGSFSIASDAPTSPDHRTLSGRGSAAPSSAQVTPTSHDFGQQPAGTTSDPFEFAVKNVGGADLHVSSVTASGPFAATPLGCGSAGIATNVFCTFTVTFHPVAGGPATGSVTVASDDPNSPATIQLSGTGTQAVPGISAPASHDFRPQVVNTASAPFTATVTNTGTGDLTISDLTVDGEFGLANSTCDTPVAAGGTCSFDLTFSPITPGARTGSVSITSNASGSPLAIQLTGTALTSKAPPVLSSPRNGALVYTQKPKLGWKAIKGATGYSVQVAGGADFASVVQSAAPKKNTLTLDTLGFGVYFWRVALGDASGQSAYSAPFSFEVTLNKTPKKDAVLKNGLVKFAWQAVKGKTYQLEVYTNPGDPAGSHAFDIVSGKKTSYSLPRTSPLTSGVYYWRVSIDGGATWTPGWRFTIP